MSSVPRAVRCMVAALGVACLIGCAPDTSETKPGPGWPQAAGPNLNWKVQGPDPVLEWSGALDRNIVWRSPLPNGGQSGIAVAKGRVFLTTFDTYRDGQPKYSNTILGHCLDERTGKLLWSVRLEGSLESPLMYAYSDSTTPSPMTDGEHVWFVNASGAMGAWDMDGNEVWTRRWQPWGDPFPFNKQHEPILFGDWIINVEPADSPVPPEKVGWNYLCGIDKLTGETAWVAEDGTTTYATSVFGRMADGTPAILTGRGGWHDVPERPVGLSLVSLRPEDAGKTIWRWVAATGPDGKPLAEPGSVQAPTWQALYTLHWDEKQAYFFRMNPVESHLILDSTTGRLLREQSLIDNVDYRQWDPAAGKYIVHRNVNLRQIRELSERNPLAADEVIRVQPMWHANLTANGYHYFFTSTGHSRNRYPPKGKAGPTHCVARVNLETGKAEYFELPVAVVRESGKPDERIYGRMVRTSALNSRGQDVAAEDRSKRDGWQIPAFWGSPTLVNNRLYVTSQIGITYVIDTAARELDENALLAVNDLGVPGETWSLNSISYDGGTLYHRSLKEVFRIGPR